MFGILRTILAINVILLHIFNIPTLGNFSVTFFFMLSGFLMTLIVNEKYGFNFKGFVVFWINRILRLFPMYWMIMSFSVIIILLTPTFIRHPHMYLPNSFTDWLSNITMIYPNIVPSRIEPRIIPPSWAISNELVYYFLISLGISKTKKRTLIWLLFSVLYFIYTYLFYDLATFRYGAIPAASLSFSLGGVLYWYKKELALLLSRKQLIVLVLIFAFYLNGIFSKEIQAFLIKDLSVYINLVIAFIIIACLFNFKCSNKIRKIDNYIGLYSYPFYISHYLVALSFSYFIGIGMINGSFKLDLSVLPLYFMFLILFTLLLVHFVDYPVENYRRKLKKHLD